MAMIGTNTREALKEILKNSLDDDTRSWLEDKLSLIVAEGSTRQLFLTYSLMASKIPDQPMKGNGDEAIHYLVEHQATLREAARLYLLVTVLETDRETFSPGVAKLIEVADKGELETFLRFLPILPHGEDFKKAAVESLRTNISTVFEAIALDNPYPAKHFNQQQWNQMYLKAAFMQLDLSRIPSVDDRANADLTRIISDYAHERWAASRPVDPMFWRPVAGFLEGPLMEDMKHLFKSDNPAENRAAALCCYHSGKEEALQLLENNPQLADAVRNGNINWDNLKN